MRSIVLMLGLAAAFTSCSNDDVVDLNKSNLISFESHVNKGTRAPNTTTESISTFQVWGYYQTANNTVKQVFNNQFVWKETNNTWTYSPPVPWTANKYCFGACSTGSGDPLNNVTFSNAGVLTIPDYNINQTHDVVAAIAKVDNTGLANEVVGLNFKHLTTKVRFEVTNGSTEPLTMKLENIALTAKCQGTCTFTLNDNGTTTTSWTVGTQTTGLSFQGTGGTAIDKGTTFTTEDHMLMPQTLDGITASFQVVFYRNGSTEFKRQYYTDVPLETASVDTWLPGNIYTYTMSVKPDMPTIKFSVSSVVNRDGETTNILN